MYLPTLRADNLRSRLDALDANEALMVLVGQESADDLEACLDTVVADEDPVFGGVFPGLLVQNEIVREGAILKSFPVLAPPLFFDFSDTERGIRELEQLVPRLDKDGGTAVVWTDGLSEGISDFLRQLFGRVGDAVNYIGGGTGFALANTSEAIRFIQRPSLITPTGLAENTASVTFSPLQTNLGVRHGWRRVMGPLVATRTDRNVILDLNWRPAFEVYRETVDRDSGRTLTHDNFFEVAKNYPFGLHREGGEHVVRLALAVTPDGHLLCGGEVPENSVLTILKGEADDLLAAAGGAVKDCGGSEAIDIHSCLIADCVTRPYVLGDSFSRELEALTDQLQDDCPEVHPEGALTLGEIASYGGGFLEYLNKTIVVGIFHA